MRNGLLGWAAGLTLAAQAGGDFEIKVGDRTYSASEGQPVTIVTPRGEEVPLTVSRPAIRTFEHAGLKFDYPAGMTKEEAALPNVHQVSVETVNSTLFMAQILGADVSGPAALQEFLNAVREQAAQMSGSPPEESAARRGIGGKMTDGRKLVWKLGKLENTTEVYLLADQTPGSALLIFQSDQEDRAESEACFKVIAGSLKRTGGTVAPPKAP